MPAQIESASDLSAPFISKRTVVTSCSDFLPVAEARRQGFKNGASLHVIMERHGVRDLCSGCPHATEDDCKHFAWTTLAQRIAMRTGRGIELTTLCCTDLKGDIVPVRSSERLFQIKEPAP